MAPMRSTTALVFLLSGAHALSFAHPRMQMGAGVQYRVGAKEDEALIAGTMLRELMNPLGISHERFLVATEAERQVGFGQIRPLGDDDWELASVYVVVEARQQGIGSSLVRQLLEMHSDAGRDLSRVYLLTLGTTQNWYEEFGFAVTQSPPPSMSVEVAAGGAISRILGNELVCMKYQGASCVGDRDA
jgi:N-acetylglutamate synthase-like GNAT family acetyltransferase